MKVFTMLRFWNQSRLIGLENGLHSLGKISSKEIFFIDKILNLKNNFKS